MRPHTLEGQSLGELRTIKGALLVTLGAAEPRAPYPRERLVEGETLSVPSGGLAWMRRDGGTTWLVSGPAKLVVHSDKVEVSEGKLFVDGEPGAPVELLTPRGKVELADARASLDVLASGVVSVYVLRGSARVAESERVAAGEIVTLGVDGKAVRAPMLAWEDWTGGLATADPALEPAPFGIGTVGARRPGDTGKPRFSLVVQRLEVRVSIERDFAVTEVDETFVNPSSDVVEGIFSFRTPPRAVLHRFGVDRAGELVWGRVKESAAATQQYERNVYEGSDEDPALLQWAGAGIYTARLYPIRPGATRRVVTRYAEWLGRQGPNAERRLYIYPMAAEGARGSLPRIEELSVTFDLSRAQARAVRIGMGGKREGDRVVVKAFDFVPRADLALELFDDGQKDPVAYRAPHRLAPEEAPTGAADDFSRQVSQEEADYVALPLRVQGHAQESGAGLDLAIVVDTSAATEPAALAITRSMTASLLAHLGPEDRAALWTGDAKLRPVASGSDSLAALGAETRKAWLAGLAKAERGGATDLGALLTEAANKLDPKRRGAVVYIGDGQPSVGETAPKALRERLARLAPTTRILAAGVGSQANLALLETVARGAPVEPVADAYTAARAALRLLEAAGRPLWLGAQLDLGPGIERILPGELPPISADESIIVVGRITGKVPSSMTLKGSGGSVTHPLVVRELEDAGDLRRRWGEARLQELTRDGAGRAALVEVGRRFGLVSPVTSLYVPTEREVVQAEFSDEALQAAEQAKIRRWKPWVRSFAEIETARRFSALAEEAPAEADNKEGGTGTRAKGEEGSMGNAAASGAKRASAESSLSLEAAPELEARQRPSAQGDGSKEASRGNFWGDAPATSPPAAAQPAKPAALAAGAPPLDLASRNSGLDLSGIGAGGGGRGEGIGLGSIGTLGHGAGTGQGFGSGGPGKRRAKHPDSQAEGRDADSDRRALVDRAASREPVRAALGVIGHEARPCGAAADLPFSERLVLWRERLAGASSVDRVLPVYRQALSNCEAPRWNERAALLVYMVDRLQTVRDRVQLFHALLALSPAAADAVYRFILVRVQTAADLDELHRWLGLERVQPELLAQLLTRARSPQERLGLLRDLAQRFADDTELALLVLDAYEDVADDAGGRAWARRLRRRADATAHVRTNVGEYYLRLAKRETGAAASNDSEEGRRTFGELVEFAPEDPLARRRLGDLLRAHGWYDEAARQYETLAELTPEDASVPLLLAAAAQGMGKVEEAVRWTEKAMAAGSPDGNSAEGLAARALASVFLAWAREDAAKAGRVAEVEQLRARALRLASPVAADTAPVRFILTWSHPELRPALWSGALGSPMPVEDNLPLYGVAQTFLAKDATGFVEIRLDPEDAERAARLDAKVVLTALTHEGTPDELITHREIGFRADSPADPKSKPARRERVRVRFERGALQVEAQSTGELP